MTDRLTLDIRICRTHNRSSLDYPDKFGVSDGWCAVGSADIVEQVAGRQPCDPVPMRWSADGHALLAIEECPTTEVIPSSEDLVGFEVPCPKCGGSGWKLLKPQRNPYLELAERMARTVNPFGEG